MIDHPKIALFCRGCGNVGEYSRDVDPDIPVQVARIEMSLCPRCDNGDFCDEFWLDASGNEVSQMPEPAHD